MIKTKNQTKDTKNYINELSFCYRPHLIRNEEEIDKVLTKTSTIMIMSDGKGVSANSSCRFQMTVFEGNQFHSFECQFTIHISCHSYAKYLRSL